MKAVVIFPSFLFPQMRASYYFLTKGSQATPASKGPFRQERQWGPAHLLSLAYHCCRIWLHSSYGSRAGKRTLASTSRRPAGPTEVLLTSRQKCWRSNNIVCKGRTAHSPLQYLAPWSQSHAERRHWRKWRQDGQWHSITTPAIAAVTFHSMDSISYLCSICIYFKASLTSLDAFHNSVR